VTKTSDSQSTASGLLSEQRVPDALTAHPRVLLDTTTLSSLRQRARGNDPAWVALRQTCDGYLLGHVEWPDGNHDPGANSVG
jgi:hypothetical protein